MLHRLALLVAISSSAIAQGELVVCGFSSNSVGRYDATTGQFIGLFRGGSPVLFQAFELARCRASRVIRHRF